MARAKKYEVGDHIQGYNAGHQFVHGIIARVNKNSYSLEKGGRIDFGFESDFDAEYWESEVKKSVATAVLHAIKSLDASKFPDDKIIAAFKTLFGAKHLKLVEDSVRKSMDL